MRRNVLVYIAGPMTARGDKSVEEHVAVAVKTLMTLIKAGIPAFCPHLTAAFPSAWTVFDYKVWLEYDLAIVDRCTHMLMLPGWEESHGASVERDYALTLRRMPVAYSIDELMEMIK